MSADGDDPAPQPLAGLKVVDRATLFAGRVMRIVGHPEVLEPPWYASHDGRIAHAKELDAIVAEWIAERTRDEVLAAFAGGQGAIAPVLSIADIVADEHFRARETITTVEHPALGPVKEQNVIAKLLASPGRIRHAGPALGEHNREVYGALGVSDAELDRLREKGVIQ